MQILPNIVYVTVGVWPLMDRAGGAYNSFQGAKYDINITTYFSCNFGMLTL